jgi:hypothetical protein
MKRSSVRRRNGVGAYQIFLGDLLKKAKTKGKSKAAREAAFRKARAEAARLAKGTVPAAIKARAEKRNKEVQAKKAARRASGKTSARPARTSAAPAAASGKAGFTGTRKGKGKRVMYFLKGKMVSKEKYMAAGGKASPAKASPKKASGSKSKARPMRASAAKPARAGKSSDGFTGTRKGAKGRLMYFVAGKMVSKATYEARGKKGKASGKVTKLSKRKASARKNPNLAGLLDGAKQFARDAFSVQGILGAALVGVAHGYVAPRVDAFLSDKVPARVNVPMLGSIGLNNFSFTATGTVAGAALGSLGYALGRPTLGLGLGVLAFASGIVLDVVSLVLGKDAEAGDAEADSDMGEMFNRGVEYGEMYNRGVEYGEIYDAVAGGPMTYGDVALDGSVAPGYGGIMEDGSVVGGGYGAMHNEYADAMAGDAEFSGPDFSAAEGQALMDGSAAFFSKFGRSPVRATGVRTKTSRHAGRAGHRWGWLIKLVGMDKAAQIAALPPEKRLQVIATLRKQAMDSLANLMAEQAAGTTAQNLLPAPQDTGLDLTSLSGGAMGAGGALGYGNVNVYAGSGF